MKVGGGGGITQLKRRKFTGGREIPSVLQIRREIATTEGQDQDFNIEPKETESTALSQQETQLLLPAAPERAQQKTERELGRP